MNLPPKNTLKVGTAVKIQTVLSVKNPDSITIEIEDPNDAIRVAATAMTKVADTVYQYIFQSTSTDELGEYTVTIKATYGPYISVEQSWFALDNMDLLYRRQVI